MRNVRTKVLTELLRTHNTELSDDQLRDVIRLSLQAAGYPPDAEEVSGVDAVAILERLDAGLVRRVEPDEPPSGPPSPLARFRHRADAKPQPPPRRSGDNLDEQDHAVGE